MKTRKQMVISRIFCMVVSIFLLASFFVLPVCALDEMSTVVVKNIFYDYGSDPDADQRPFSSLHAGFFSVNQLNLFDNITSSISAFRQPDSIINDDPYLTFEYSDFYNSDMSDTFKAVYYINQLFDDGVTRSFSKGDTCFIDPGMFYLWLDTDAEFTDYRFVLRDLGNDYSFSFGKVVASTKTIPINFDMDSSFIEYDQLAFNFLDDVKSDSLCLCLEFTGNVLELPFSITFEAMEFVIRYGSGVSPNYPIYPSAPGGDDIGHLDSQEQQLIQDSQAGLDTGVDVMENTGNLITDLEADLNLVAFTGALNQILNRIILIPGLDPLVHISLSLGLFASLFGLAASIISAASHRSGQAASESKRESRKK